jgi:hypothetical protein
MKPRLNPRRIGAPQVTQALLVRWRGSYLFRFFLPKKIGRSDTLTCVAGRMDFGTRRVYAPSGCC